MRRGRTVAGWTAVGAGSVFVVLNGGRLAGGIGLEQVGDTVRSDWVGGDLATAGLVLFAAGAMISAVALFRIVERANNANNARSANSASRVGGAGRQEALLSRRDGVAGDGLRDPAQGGDLRPVGGPRPGGPGVHGRDRRLQPVGPGRS